MGREPEPKYIPHPIPTSHKKDEFNRNRNQRYDIPHGNKVGRKAIRSPPIYIQRWVSHCYNAFRLFRASTKFGKAQKEDVTELRRQQCGYLSNKIGVSHSHLKILCFC